MKRFWFAPLLLGLGSNASAELMITAVYDGPLTGGLPKGVELYARSAIADASLYGLGSANNGGGSDGQEFTFPAHAFVEGQTIYVAFEEAGFTEFMGFAPDYTSAAMSINGDDAIELFQNGSVIDVFGEADVDGSGQSWEYTDGWAYRRSGSTATVSFQPAQWIFSGANALDGALDNASAATPIPLAQYGTGGVVDPGEGDGTGGGEPSSPVAISAIQGTPQTQVSNRFGETDVSPLHGQVVTIEAVVVGDFQDNDDDPSRNLGGFYVQEEAVDEDGNPQSSEGIFVHAPNTTTDVQQGDLVRITGTVDQYFGETQLADLVNLSVLASDRLQEVSQAEVHLADITQVSQSQNGRHQPDLEAYEGMWVRISDTLTITEQFQLDRFNEIRLIAGERPYQFTQIHSPSAAQLDDYSRTIAARSIVYDDGRNQQNVPVEELQGFASYTEATAPRMGDQAPQLSGVLDYKWAGNSASGATWRVRATSADSNTFTSTARGNSANPRPLDAPEVSGDLRVASFNVLNLFTTIDSGTATTAAGHDPRGADTPAEFERQLNKLVQAITAMNADVLGLVELENEFDAVNDGSTAIEVLVNALNAAVGEVVYDYVYPGQRFVGSDAIAVGMIYKPAVVALAPQSQPALLDDAAAQALPAFAQHDFTRQPIFDGPATNRVPLAASFIHTASGEQFTVVANHFKSKGAADLSDSSNINFDQGDGAGFWNARRLDAAVAVSEWLQTSPTGISDDDVIILGDLNAYAAEQPVQYLFANGFQNIESPESYSYVFDGLIGTLDYLLVSDALKTKLQDAAVWHINADEADALDYNLDFGRSAAYYSVATATRSSDHDPIIAGFAFEQSATAWQQIWQYFAEAIEAGAIAGESRSPVVAALQVQGFALLLTGSEYLYRAGDQEGACQMLDGLLLLADSDKKPKNWLTGDVAQLSHSLLSASSEWDCR